MDGSIGFSCNFKEAGIFDPTTGRIGRARGTFFDSAGKTCVRLQLAPGQSCIVKTFDHPPDGPDWTYYRPQDKQPLTGTWIIEFVKGGPELPAASTTDKLGSWTEFGGESMKAFSGTAKYTLKFAKPQAGCERLAVEFGARCGELSGLAQREGIGYANRPAVFDRYSRRSTARRKHAGSFGLEPDGQSHRRHGSPQRATWKRFYNANVAARDPANRGAGNVFSAANWTPRESGLIGPVTLTALETFDPDTW